MKNGQEISFGQESRLPLLQGVVTITLLLLLAADAARNLKVQLIGQHKIQSNKNMVK